MIAYNVQVLLSGVVFWFVQPWVFVAVTTLIVLVLYRRDFMSQTYAAMRR